MYGSRVITRYKLPDEEVTPRQFALGVSFLVMISLALSIELSRPQSGFGWIMRDLFGIVLPRPQLINPMAEKLKRLNVTEADIDIVVRTVIGEAAREPEEGKVAVIWVILNRAMHNVSWYGGNNVAMVSLHQSTRERADGRRITTWQFEPWMARRDYLWMISKYSQQYQYVRGLVVKCVNGTLEDPTDGATHFLEPRIVIRRSGKLPLWAQSNGKRIGSHVFFKHGNGEVLDFSGKGGSGVGVR